MSITCTIEINVIINLISTVVPITIDPDKIIAITIIFTIIAINTIDIVIIIINGIIYVIDSFFINICNSINIALLVLLLLLLILL